MRTLEALALVAVVAVAYRVLYWPALRAAWRKLDASDPQRDAKPVAAQRVSRT